MEVQLKGEAVIYTVPETGPCATRVSPDAKVDIDTRCGQVFLLGMIAPSLFLAFGLAAMFAPRFFATRPEADRLRRLEELEGGATEVYFEERRDLLAYKPSQRLFLLWRIVGAAIALTASGLLIVRSGLAG